MIIPTKPFPAYKWRWASFQPSEGLNDPSVFLGVLRVFRNFEGEPTSSSALLNSNDLALVFVVDIPAVTVAVISETMDLFQFPTLHLPLYRMPHNRR